MKRALSIVLSMVLLLNLLPTAFAAEPRTETLPSEINADTVWSYLDDNTDPAGDSEVEGYNRTSWTLPDYDDSAWKKAAGSFGSKNNSGTNGAVNKLEGCYGSSAPDNYPAYFFRTRVTIEDASAVKAITGLINYDDAVILYINGTQVFGGNADGIVSNTQYSLHGGNESDELAITDEVALAALKNGENVIAAEVHNDKPTSSDILFDLTLAFSTELPAQTSGLVTDKTEWSYLDDNTDPATNLADRTAWTAAEFDDSTWKTGAGPFGSKKGNNFLEDGYTAATVLAGCDGANNTPTYFLRTTFHVDSLEGMTQLVGTLEYDDGVILYINGTRIAAFDDNACDVDGTPLGYGFNANLQYGGSNGGTPKTATLQLLDLSLLHVGENTLAVELHNGRQTSSDVWFRMSDLSLSDEELKYQSNISLSMGTDESQMNLTWQSFIAEAGTVTYDRYADLVGGKLTASAQIVTAEIAAANEENTYSNKATLTGLEPNTLYAYQLTNDSRQSDIYTFTTASNDAFSFAYVGDPQIGAGGNAASDTTGWDNTLKIIDTNTVFSDVSFMLSAGDQVNTASNEDQYDGYLDHDPLLSLPVATVIGNHDSSSNAYKQHFNVPNESAEYGATEAGGDYYFVYNNVLFLILNSNDTSAAEHRQFMEDAIAATADQDIQWKVVSFHHSVYTVASHSSDSYITSETGFKNTIVPVLNDLGIDVVLQGHDHVYCRSYIMDGFTAITESDQYEYANGTDQAPTSVNDPDGILYVTANSGSGSKTYDIKMTNAPFSAVQNQEHIPNVSKVTVSDKQFTITTYRTTDMTVVDTFTIKRDGGDSPITQTDISLSMGADESRMNLTWYANVDGEGTLTLAKQNELVNGAMPETAAAIKAASGIVNKEGFYNYQATMTGLEPNTTYAYQLTNSDRQSRIYTFTTGGSGDFSFAYVGDPQIGAGSLLDKDLSGWKKTLGIIDSDDRFSSVSFMLSAGDQVNVDDNEDQYDAYLNHDELMSLPVATVIGNHDSDSNAYGQHFNVANESDELGITPAGGDSYFVYNHVLFMVLNANDSSVAEHQQFMKDAIAATADQDIIWKVVSFHQSIYSVANHSTSSGIVNLRNGLTPVLDALDIDVVLMGHDHSYCRTYIMDGLTPITESDKYAYANGTDQAPTSVADPDGVLYVTANSGSGSKTYTIKTDVEFPYAAVMNQEYVPNVSRVDITDTSFTITTYRTNDMTVVDSFTIYHSSEDSGDSGNSGGSGTSGSSSSSGSHAITVANTANGSVSLSSASASKGTAVTITVKPDAGYALNQITVKDAAGNSLKVTEAGNQKYTFQMPASAVKVNVSFAKAEESADNLPFIDVPDSAWYKDAAEYVYENGLMNGTSATTFSPNGTTTRGMIVTILYRLEGAPTAGAANFSDVPANQYYSDAVAWGATNGIVNGYGNGAFGPNDPITREQMATILYRYAAYKGYDVTARASLSGFTDVTAVNSYAVEPLQWANAHGLMNGTSTTTLTPNGSATRAQVATILMRFCVDFVK